MFRWIKRLTQHNTQPLDTYKIVLSQQLNSSGFMPVYTAKEFKNGTLNIDLELDETQAAELLSAFTFKEYAGRTFISTFSR